MMMTMEMWNEPGVPNQQCNLPANERMNPPDNNPGVGRIPANPGVQEASVVENPGVQEAPVVETVDDDEEEMDDNPTSSVGDMETMHWIQRQVHEELQSNTQKWCQVAWGLCGTETQHAKGCDVANYDGHLVWLYWRHLAANQASRSARVPVSCQDAKH